MSCGGHAPAACPGGHPTKDRGGTDDDPVNQMDLLYGVAFLLDLVGLDIDQLHARSNKAQPAR